MRNEFVGDIGDFSKYGLLSALTRVPENHTPDVNLVLGVLWFLNKKIVALDEYEELKECCPALFSKLRRTIANDNRTVSVIKNKNVLSAYTKYYDTPLPKPLTKNRRTEWFAQAKRDLARTNLVYLDPDTGIKVQIDPGVRFYPNDPVRGLSLEEMTNSREHVSLGELRCLNNEGKSLIIYQHVGQGNRKHEGPEHRIRAISQRLSEGLNHADQIWNFRWTVGPGRAYFIVALKEHREEIERRLRVFCKTPWVTRGHFTPL